MMLPWNFIYIKKKEKKKKEKRKCWQKLSQPKNNKYYYN